MELREIQKSMLDIAVYFDEFCRDHDLQYVICGGSLLGAVRHKNFIPWDDDFDVAMPRDDFNKCLQIWKDTKTFSMIKVGDCNYYKPSTPAKIFLRGTRVAEINEKENGMPEFCPYGVFLDIFPLDEYPDTFFGNLSNKFVGKLILAKSLSNYHLRKKSFPKRLCIKVFKYVPKIFFTYLQEIAFKYIDSKRSKASKSFIGYGVETPFSNLKIEPSAIWPAKRDYSIDNVIFYGPNSYEKYLMCRYGDYMMLPKKSHRMQHIVGVKYIDE